MSSQINHSLLMSVLEHLNHVVLYRAASKQTGLTTKRKAMIHSLSVPLWIC